MSERNPRHNPYARVVEGPVVTRPLTTLWRWRTEIVLAALAAVAVAGIVAALGRGLWWAPAAFAGPVWVPAMVPAGRQWARRHFWCLFSRHRLQRVCLETSMHTAAGRIPLVLWITPTECGEKAFILLRAGICADDFEAFSGEIAAACCASGVRVRRDPRRAQFVSVEIVRGDAAPAAGAWGDGEPGLARPAGKLAG